MLGAALPIAAPHIAAAMKNPNGAIRTVKHTAGRLMGLSGADLGALEANGGTVTGIPGWFWGVIGLTAGALAATYFATKRPDLVPNCLAGDR